MNIETLIQGKKTLNDFLDNLTAVRGENFAKLVGIVAKQRAAIAVLAPVVPDPESKVMISLLEDHLILAFKHYQVPETDCTDVLTFGDQLFGMITRATHQEKNHGC